MSQRKGDFGGQINEFRFCLVQFESLKGVCWALEGGWKYGPEPKKVE